MTTLTRMYLNPQKRAARKLLTNPQAMHAAVRAAFPPDIAQDEARVLWRMDDRRHEHVLYIVGPEKPDATHLMEQAGWDTRPAQSADYTRLLDSLMVGQRWRFELVANPVKSEAGKRGTRGTVKPHVTPKQQLDWLVQRSPGAGFQIPQLDSDSTEDPLFDATVIGRENLRFFRKTEQDGLGKGRVSLRTARFSGYLEVTDGDKLRHTLTQGIGRARAYGCGLLTLAKPVN